MFLHPELFALLGFSVYIILVIASIIGLAVFLQALVRISQSMTSIARSCEQLTLVMTMQKKNSEER